MKKAIQAVLFDLDNTLYDEREFIVAALKHVSARFAVRVGVGDYELLSTMLQVYEEKGSLYPNLFDEALRRIGCAINLHYVASMVRTFHESAPPLTLYRDAAECLRVLKGKVKLGIVTNGRALTQRRKIRALGLDELLDCVVFAEEQGAEKPAVEPFQAAAAQLRIDPECVAFVGDNPPIDFPGANRLSMFTIRITRGEFANAVPSNASETPLRTISDYWEFAGWVLGPATEKARTGS